MSSNGRLITANRDLHPFTGIAVTGPRQLAIAAWIEGADDFYVGREFHFAEWAPSVVAFAIAQGDIGIGSQEAMRFVYNYDNRIEENALIDVGTGQDMFVNGQIYVSGAQRSLSANDIKSNDILRNYLYDSFNHSSNDYALYSDSDQDAARYIGNMINGLLNSDHHPEPTPVILAFNQWAESENEGLGQILLRANVTENSTFCNDAECRHTLGLDYVEEGQVINGVGGDAAFLDIYQQMYAAIDEGNFPQIATLPGAQAMRDRLATLITGFGGTIPLAGDFNQDGIVDAADYTVWRDTLGSATDLRADGSRNGVIDQADHDFWQTNFGTVASLPASSANIPEPAGLGLLSIGVLSLSTRHQRLPRFIYRGTSHQRNCQPTEKNKGKEKHARQGSNLRPAD